MATHLDDVLPEVERLTPACIRILGGNPGNFTLQGTNTYLLGTGPSRILIDTGEGRASWIVAVRRTLEKENATIASALITHWHHDHVGGVRQLLELSPETKVYKCDPGDGQLDIDDGQIFRTDGATLEAVHTPGHTTDHMVFIWKEEDALFTGDNVLGHGTTVFEDLADYVASLEKMRKLFRGRAYPGHGAVLLDGPGKVLEYVKHRQAREQHVIRALRSPNPRKDGYDDDDQASSWTSMELVKVIYKEVPESLHVAAEGNVRHVLLKLEKEGKVHRDGDRWALRESSAL